MAAAESVAARERRGRMVGSIRCANARVEDRDVYINAGPSSPMRAPGWRRDVSRWSPVDELARS